MAARNDYGFGKPEIPSSSAMPFFLTVDPQQLKLRNETNVSSTSSNSPSDSASPNLKNGTSPLFMPFNSYMALMAECSSNKIAYTTLNTPKTSTELPVKLRHDKRSSFEAPDLKEHESVFPTHEIAVEATRKEYEYTSKSGFTSCNEYQIQLHKHQRQRKQEPQLKRMQRILTGINYEGRLIVKGR